MVNEEVSVAKLKKAIGKKVEIVAFGITYEGTLKNIDVKNGVMRIEDKEDYVVLEIERVELFRLLRR